LNFEILLQRRIPSGGGQAGSFGGKMKNDDLKCKMKKI